MDNVTGKCAECGDEMQGRVDRKFCSAACRQKAYRSKHNVTPSRNVTAEPFQLTEGVAASFLDDGFWEAVSKLPTTLGTLSVFRAGANYEEMGYDEPPLVAVSPPQRKRKDLAEQDIQLGQGCMQEFLDGYDEMVQNLASMKVTAEQIMKRNGWGSTAV